MAFKKTAYVPPTGGPNDDGEKGPQHLNPGGPKISPPQKIVNYFCNRTSKINPCNTHMMNPRRSHRNYIKLQVCNVVNQGYSAHRRTALKISE